MSDPKDPTLDPKPDNGDEPEGWEALTEAPGAGTMGPSDELEAALREASSAVEARGEAHVGGGSSAQPAGTNAGEAVMEALATELQSLKAAYEDKVSEFDTLNDQHLRLQAEFENFRRRNLKEREEAHRYGHQNLVKDLLSVVDNLDRAIEHAEQSAGGDLQGLLQGVELVRRELLAALAKHNVAVIEAADQTFDPALHEAMAQTPDGSVYWVLTRGR